VTFYHILKLFQPANPDAIPILNPDGSVVPPTPVIDTKKRLVSEFYDEIVFHEPSQMMQQMLNTVQPVTGGSWSHDTDCKEEIYRIKMNF
jgi:YEATS domain-containing protein 4